LDDEILHHLVENTRLIAYDADESIRARARSVPKKQYKSGNPDGSKWLETFSPLFEELGIIASDFEKHIVNLKPRDLKKRTTIAFTATAKSRRA
jgi:hypothetical protein